MSSYIYIHIYVYISMCIYIYIMCLAKFSGGGAGNTPHKKTVVISLHAVSQYMLDICAKCPGTLCTHFSSNKSP